MVETDEDPAQMPFSGCWKNLPPNRKLCLQPLASQATRLGQHGKETQELTAFQNSHYYIQIYLKSTKTIDLALMQEESTHAATPAGRSAINKGTNKPQGLHHTILRTDPQKPDRDSKTARTRREPIQPCEDKCPLPSPLREMHRSGGQAPLMSLETPEWDEEVRFKARYHTQNPEGCLTAPFQPSNAKSSEPL